MSDKSRDEALQQIEETQHALRQSIERTRGLAAEAERLIERHRKETSQPRD